MPVLDKWAIYDHPHISWEPNAGQLKIAEDEARHQVLAGGRRFGKSRTGAMRTVPEIFYTKPLATTLADNGQRREFWFVGPEYSDSEKEFRVVWNLVKKLQMPMEKGSYNNPESGDMQIVLWDGTFILSAKSARYPERLVGEGLAGVVLCEAAKLKASIWPKFIRPALSDFEGWSLHSSTPEGKNWFYELHSNAKDPANKAWSAFRMPAWINHYVYKQPTRTQDVLDLVELSRTSHRSVFTLAEERGYVIDPEILQELNDLTPEAFLQEICADFTEFVGRVFKEFDEDVHVTDIAYNPTWDTVAAVDFGYTNPNVWLLIQIGPWGEINVLDEVYQSGLDPEEFADEIIYHGLNPSTLRTFFADPADPGAAKILERKLFTRSASRTGGELQDRLNWIRKALRQTRYVIDSDVSNTEEMPAGFQRPRLMFDRKCKHTIQDFLDYRYPEKRSDGQRGAGDGEKPMKKSDHGPEALGRFFAGLFGKFGRDEHSPKVHEGDYTIGPGRKRSNVVNLSEYRHPAAYALAVRSPYSDPLGRYLRGETDGQG